MIKSLQSDPKGTSAAGLILIVPGALLLLLLVLGIEPPLGLLEALLKAPPGQPNIAGTALALAAILVMPGLAAFANLLALRQAQGKALDIAALGVMILGVLVIVLFVSGIVVDQYPCWIGVPNCD